MRAFDEELAAIIGLEKAIIIQQIDYWIKIHTKNKINFKDGYYWVYNTIPEWQEQLPFLTRSMVKKCLQELKAQEIIITANHNRMKRDKTLWYRIDYDKLAKVKIDPSEGTETNPSEDIKINPSERIDPDFQCEPSEMDLPRDKNELLGGVKIDPCKGENQPFTSVKNEPMLPNINYTKTTTEITRTDLEKFIIHWTRNHSMKMGFDYEISDEAKHVLQQLIDEGLAYTDWFKRVKEYFSLKRPKANIEDLLKMSG